MSQQSPVKEKILLEAKRLGIDLVGVASIKRLSSAPPHHKPTDIMNEAKSVIVLAQKCIHGSMANSHWTSYTLVHEGNDSRLNNAAYYLSRFIEDNYSADAIPIPANAPYYHWDECSQYGAGDLSHKHAAVAAGLGTIGKNSLLITPQYGNKVNLVSVITDLDIEADSPIEAALCPSSCRLCIDACPVKAINGDYTINQAVCRSHCWTKLPKGFPVLHCWECRRICPV